MDCCLFYLLSFLSTVCMYVVVYPLMKRFTNWPQLILGLTFNWGALVGYAVYALPKFMYLYISIFAHTYVCMFIDISIHTLAIT